MIAHPVKHTTQLSTHNMTWYQTKDAEDVIQHESLSESEKKG